MPESRTVYLHVGTGKSGTTYLQRILFKNRELLKRHGVLYPGKGTSHFLASMDLRGSGFNGYDYPEAEGAWDRLVEEAQAHTGNVLVSHETFGRARPAQIEKAVAAFPGSEVRVIITCRDLGRQIPAAWQERIKNRKNITYDAFLDRVFTSWDKSQTSVSSMFWKSQNLIALTQRWSRAVGTENVRLVTVPAPGTAPDELWRRFASAADLPNLDYEIPDSTSNASIGTTETELLRRLNPMFPEDLAWPQYAVRIKNRFVQRDLSQHNTSGRLTVPDCRHETTEQIAGEMIDFLRGSGCPVIGDLEELRPVFRADSVMPDEVGTEELLGLALELLARAAARPRTARSEYSGRTAARVLARKVRERIGIRR